MAVEIGTVQTFSDVSLDFSAGCLMGECADVIQATCNLVAAYGVTDFTAFMEACRKRNAERGRM